MNSALTSKITGLWLEANGNRLPLMVADVKLEMPLPSCTVMPVVGNAPIDGKRVDPQTLDALTIGTKAKVIIVLGGRDVTLFSGRVVYRRFDHFRGAYPTSSTFVPIISLGHNILDLSSLVMTTVIFSSNTGSTKYPPFIGGMYGWDATGRFSTDALASRQLASHIREILSLLADWYQRVSDGGEALVNVNNLVKASTCAYRDIITSMGPKPLADAVIKLTSDVVNNAVVGRQTFYNILNALADYCLLSIIPRLEDAVLVPETVGFKRPVNAPIISRKYVTRVRYGESKKAIPINRVAVNYTSTYGWSPEETAGRSESIVTLSGSSVYPGSFYPKAEAGKTFLNAIQVSAPPILSKLLVGVSTVSGDKQADIIPSTMEDGAYATAKADRGLSQSGEAPFNQSTEDAITIMEATEKMMYGSLAYSGGMVEISLVLEGLIAHSKSIKHSDGSIYALLGQVIGVEAALPGEQTQASSSFVGYVNSVAISVNLQASDLSCQITLSNVRTKAEDDQHSIALSEHPLYENVEDAGVE